VRMVLRFHFLWGADGKGARVGLSRGADDRPNDRLSPGTRQVFRKQRIVNANRDASFASLKTDLVLSPSGRRVHHEQYANAEQSHELVFPVS
jgi:hypothetical protein